MSKKMIRLVCLIVILLSSLPTWAQDDKEEKIPLYYDDETELKGGRPRTVFLIPKLYKKGNLIYLRTNEDRCSVKLTIISVDNNMSLLKEVYAFGYVECEIPEDIRGSFVIQVVIEGSLLYGHVQL